MKKYLIFGYDKVLINYLILNNIEVSLILDKWDLMDSIQISNNDLENDLLLMTHKTLKMF